MISKVEIPVLFQDLPCTIRDQGFSARRPVNLPVKGPCIAG